MGAVGSTLADCSVGVAEAITLARRASAPLACSDERAPVVPTTAGATREKGIAKEWARRRSGHRAR
jgi:hypothetical protein